MAIHSIFERPLMSLSGMLIRQNSNSVVRLQVVQSSYDLDAVKATDPNTRNCITNKEVELGYLRSQIDYR